MGYTQNLFPNNYYQSPIAIPLKVAGNFGELRPFHFHAGVDLKTNNKTGLSVHAVSDGYISRVKVSSFGYGKVIYITHSNGTVSVYAHLSAFNKELELYVRQTQYERKSFDVDLVLDRNKFIVKKNDIIAFSGNTGNSFGPHLHFEIRNATTEKAINPLVKKTNFAQYHYLINFDEETFLINKHEVQYPFPIQNIQARQ